MANALAAKLDQARDLLRRNEPEKARLLLSRLVRQHAAHADVNQLLCLAHVMQGQNPQGLYYAQRAVDAQPHSPELLTNLGNCCVFNMKVPESIDAFRRALGIQPSHPGARRGLGQALLDAGRLSEGIEELQTLLRQNPRDARLASPLGSALLEAGRAKEAVALLDEAVRIDPNNPYLASTRCSILNYPSGVEPRRVFEAHTAYGEIIERLAAAQKHSVHDPVDDPERPLRIGILSADLRSHSVMFYARSMVRRLRGANPGQFWLGAYYNGVEEDATSLSLKPLFDLWRPVRQLRELDLARQINADRIDILIELHGHTIGERLAALELKPAPVQVTYIGYPNTTGLRTIDYRIVDSFTDPAPPGSAEALATEKLVRLDPCFLCYSPYEGAPPPTPAPCLPRGYVTFGSFNAISKLSELTVRLWTRLLNETPGSRLLLKAKSFHDAKVMDDVRQRFREAGLDESRLDLRPPNDSRAEHLATYAEIDLALDPFPYHGTTTTCEAFHMGVPVVTLAGEAHAARVGVSLLNAIGLPELVAQGEDEFVRIASGLARDTARLAELRAGMRERLLGSALCDGPGYGMRLGAALRGMWRERCGGASTLR